MNAPDPSQTIVFFDGVCHLCNAFVDFAVKRDPERRFRFAPLQGSTAERLLPAGEREDLNTVLVWSEGRLLRRSDAVLRVMNDLGPGYRLLGLVGQLIPRPFRDGLYNSIARHRYSLFGKAETCRLPSREEKEQVLE